MKPYVVIAGPVGVGKSTLARALQPRLDVPLFLESAADQNPFLRMFYADTKRWSLQKTMWFYTEALSQQAEVTLGDGGVQDRSVYEHHEIFATADLREGRLRRDDFDLLHRFYRRTASQLRPPDALVYLTATTEQLQKRIAARGRAEEVAQPSEYFEGLHRRYERWVETFTVCPVLRVHSVEGDLHDPDHLDKLADDVLGLTGT